MHVKNTGRRLRPSGNACRADEQTDENIAPSRSISAFEVKLDRPAARRVRAMHMHCFAGGQGVGEGFFAAWWRSPTGNGKDYIPDLYAGKRSLLLIPEIEQLGVAELLLALQEPHAADETGFQPLRLVALEPFRDRPAHLPLHPVP